MTRKQSQINHEHGLDIPVIQRFNLQELLLDEQAQRNDDLTAREWSRAAAKRGVPMKTCPDCEENNPCKTCEICGGEGQIPSIDWTGVEDAF